MAITFRCTRCNQELTVKDELAGKQGKCPKCKSVLTVPTPNAAGIKKKVAEPEVIAAADVVEDDDLVEADAIDEDDDRPKRKKASSRRRDEDDEDEEDDRPRRKKRRDDEDDDDDDDRPRRKSSSKKRRDEDDEDEKPAQSPKKRRASFRRAALGTNLITIGIWVTIGSMGVSILMILLTAAASSSKSGGGKTMHDIMKIMGYLLAPGLFAGVVLRIIGSAFTITTPNKKGELAFAISCTATAGVAGIMMIILLIKFFESGGRGGIGADGPVIMWWVTMIEFHPFAPVAPWPLPIDFMGFKPSMGDISFTVFLIPYLEVTWLVLFSLYQWTVGKSNKEPEVRAKGMLLVIVVPSVCGGVGLLMFILFKAITFTNFWVPSLFNMFHLGALIGILVWFNMVTSGTKWALHDAE